MSSDAEAALRAGAAQLQVTLSEAQVRQMLDYANLIGKWGKVYNLTAVRDPMAVVTHHLLDSLAVVRPLLAQVGASAPRVMDVGSGAGLPGVVIAICCPQVQVTCVDAVAKKSAFIQQVALVLELPNLRSRHARVEGIAGPFDVICSRAFASLADFVNWSRQALADQGVWMAMKGKLPSDEIAQLPPGAVVFHVEQLTVPGLDAERCIVWLRPAAVT